MSPILEAVDTTAVATAARHGLNLQQKSLPPWLFYDQAGSQLFEQITTLPEYYLTRTERDLFERHADEIFLDLGQAVTIVELGAGTATKTGVLLEAAARFQDGVLYQPIDISSTALDEANKLALQIAGLTVRPRVANYITERVRIYRQPERKVLALYIGSSIGNFSPEEALAILRNLRSQLEPGDALLLGTDLAPSGKLSGRGKTVRQLVAAYDDQQGVTAAFNLNILGRLNRELDADFALECFVHRARWNAAESRVEMHLESMVNQKIRIPANSSGPEQTIDFQRGETIHTENSYKFTRKAIDGLLLPAGFRTARSFQDADQFFAVTIAEAV